MYGYKKPPFIKEDYRFGGSPVIAPVLMPDGQWDAFLPPDEFQNLNGIEPYACISFGLINQIEILRNFYGLPYIDYSERFLAKVSGTTEGGNDPATVYQAFREKKTVLGFRWPFSVDITSFEKFYAEIPQEVYSRAREDFPFEFFHEWVFNEDQPTDEKINNMKVALKYSPLGAAVYAWVDRGDGIYIKMSDDNHWIVIYGYDDIKRVWKIFDSYERSHKLYSYDNRIDFCKKIHVNFNKIAAPSRISCSEKFISFIKQISNAN